MGRYSERPPRIRGFFPAPPRNSLDSGNASRRCLRSTPRVKTYLVSLNNGCSATLARLAVRLVLAAVRAELLQLHPIGVVAPVLLGDVVTVLAHLACQR